MAGYKLQYFDRDRSNISIQLAYGSDDYVPGDFYVRAIRDTTDVDEHNRSKHQRNVFTISMPLHKTKTFIERFGGDNCGKVHDCKGLILEDFVAGVDESRYVDFDKPILIRN